MQPEAKADAAGADEGLDIDVASKCTLGVLGRRNRIDKANHSPIGKANHSSKESEPSWLSKR